MTKIENSVTMIREEETARRDSTPSSEDDGLALCEARWADTRYEVGTLRGKDPLTGAETRTPTSFVFPERYFPTFEDLRRLVHALLLGEHFDSHHQADYEYAAEVSSKARDNEPSNRDWLRAQIAVERAKGVDPAVRFGPDIERDPGLDRHATLANEWPSAWVESDYVGGLELNRCQVVYQFVANHFKCTYYLGDVTSDWLCPKNQRSGEEIIRASIRAIVCLYGQQGLDEILKDGEVQEVLSSTPSNEFSPTGFFPNIRLT